MSRFSTPSPHSDTAASPIDVPISSTRQAESWDDFDFNLDEEEHELLGLDGEGAHGGSRDHLSRQLLDQKASTVWDATFNFTNSIIGAGIIGLPYAFYEAGFVAGLVLLFALTFVVDWTVNLLIKDGKMAGKSSYQDLIWHCFGQRGYITISIFQFIFAYGAMCAYAVIVGDTLPLVLSHFIPNTNLIYPIISSRRIMITICTIFISLPLSLYRDVSALAKTSAISLAAIVFIILSVVGSGVALPAEKKGPAEGAMTVLEGGFFQAIGVISFAFVCHHNTFLIYGSLKKPTMDRFAVVTRLSTGFSLLACLILAVGGYLVFTSKVEANILNNFPRDHLLINLARLCFGANMFLTFPLECFVCREVIYNYVYAHPTQLDVALPHGDVGNLVSGRDHALITGALSLSAMGIALVTCDLGFVLEITGGFAATVLAYILPAACYIKLASGPTFSWKKAGPLASIFFGFVVMILSTILTLKSLFKGGEGKQCAA
ncbi:transmembrane amino acid transporter protein superfamily [Fimicolochytrium jonesii]|uniref:transmembrane amino acid transporter protein superfamily n=1 Tax=Fimicolochytrium jonesii TaxID=1396493 RepID=UPI0022FE85D4|nr:transmembrane amino acid transporter protein superfamily [Fimicolochytrium jonesii]KAI8819902.1 transmembrane amino acid transporter protein superfamily [Fimicolochytrium jonesii]